MSSDRTNIAEFFVCIFTDFKSCFESSAVEAMQSILIHEFFPNLLLNTGSVTYPNSYGTSQESYCQKSVCTPSSWIHHGVKSYVLENESINGISSARLSSWNCSHQFCPLDRFLYINGLLSWVQSMKDCCCCCRCRRCCFRGGRDFRALWRQQFPDAHLKIWPSFQRCSNLVNHTRDVHGRLGRFEVHYRSSLPSCALIVNRNSPSTAYQNSSGNSPEYSMMVLVLGDNFEFLQLYLVPVTNNFVTDCTNSNFSTLNPCFIDLSCELLWCVTVGDVFHPPRQRRHFQEPPCCLWRKCPLEPLRLESTLLGVKDLSHTLSVSRASVSERQISGIVWTIHNSRFANMHMFFCVHPSAFVCTPETRWAERHPEFVLLPKSTWEYLVLSGF